MNCRVAAIDRDPDAIARGQTIVQTFSGRLSLYEGSFSAVNRWLPVQILDRWMELLLI